METNIDYKQLFFVQRQKAEDIVNLFKKEYGKLHDDYMKEYKARLAAEQENREAQWKIYELEREIDRLEDDLEKRIIIKLN